MHVMKEQKRQRMKSYNGKLGIRRDHPCHWIEINFLRGVVFGGSSKFQVSSKCVKRFRRCGVKICFFLTALVIGSYNS